MQGRLIYRTNDGTYFSDSLLKNKMGNIFSVLPGSFWKQDGLWYAMTPNNQYVGLAKHSVVEHEDGSITVSPSIEVSTGSIFYYHGFLERGVWRSC